MEGDEKMKLLRWTVSYLVVAMCAGFFCGVERAYAKNPSVKVEKASSYGLGDGYLEKYRDNQDVQQIILVEQSRRRSRLGTLYLLEKCAGNKWKETLQCNAFLGKKGIDKTKEGDRRTPTGDYGVTMAFGIKDDPGTKMPYIKLTDKMDICGEEENYNQFVDVTKVNHKCGEDDQRLIHYVPQFNYVLFIDYNKEGIFGKGSAIFLHCRGKKRYTYGCVAVTEEDMVRVMQQVDKNVRICIYPNRKKHK